jgi:hypothetical protein
MAFFGCGAVGAPTRARPSNTHCVLNPTGAYAANLLGLKRAKAHWLQVTSS